jgi:hypothetical protein
MNTQKKETGERERKRKELFIEAINVNVKASELFFGET